MTANEYVRAYYPVPDAKVLEKAEVREEENDVLEKIATLDGEKLVTLKMLSEAWPVEYAQQWNWEQARRSEELDAASLAPVADPIESPMVPPLTELALKIALEHALETRDTQELEELVWMLGKSDALKSALLSRDNKSFPDTGIALLIKLLGEAKSDTLDLTGFPLSTQQIAKIASETHTKTTVKILKLSGNNVVTAEDICDLFSVISTIRRLWLLDTTISSEDMIRFLKDKPEAFYRIEAIVYPFFMTPYSTLLCPTAFTFSSRTLCEPTSFSLPFFMPSSILKSSVHSVPVWPSWNYGGEGRGFVMENSLLQSSPLRYAFIKTTIVTIESETTKTPQTAVAVKAVTYKLKSFVQAMVEEGRPEPSKPLGKAFADVLYKAGAMPVQEEQDGQKFYGIRVSGKVQHVLGTFANRQEVVVLILC